jgi:hypothetical protein
MMTRLRPILERNFHLSIEHQNSYNQYEINMFGLLIALLFRRIYVYVSMQFYY